MQRNCIVINILTNEKNKTIYLNLYRMLTSTFCLSSFLMRNLLYIVYCNYIYCIKIKSIIYIIIKNYINVNFRQTNNFKFDVSIEKN